MYSRKCKNVKRGRVSQEDDSDQPFRENFMREKYPIKKSKSAKCKYAKMRSFQKEIIQTKTEKVIQKVEKRYPGRFCEKGTSIRDDILMRTSIRDDMLDIEEMQNRNIRRRSIQKCS